MPLNGAPARARLAKAKQLRSIQLRVRRQFRLCDAGYAFLVERVGGTRVVAARLG